MNPLIDKFPTAVRIDGEVYSINTDFRVGLRIMQAFEDKRLLDIEKQAVMYGLLFQHQKQPENMARALDACVKFLDCGESQSDGEVDGSRPTYSWTKDARYIYSGILQTHGIDLQTVEYMHWWKFMALFEDMSDTCTFTSIVSFRRRHNEGKLSKEELVLWARMQDILSLDEVDYTPEECGKIAEFNRLMGVT